MNTIKLNTIGTPIGGGGNSGNGGGKELTRNDVNFFDYDGTLLYAYTWEEAKNLTELPPLPVHEGLEVREWNYTLEDIKEQGVEGFMTEYETCMYVGDVIVNGTKYKAYNEAGKLDDGEDGDDWAYLLTKEPEAGDFVIGANYYYDTKEWEMWTNDDDSYYEESITTLVSTIGKADVGACVYEDGEQVTSYGVCIVPRGVDVTYYTVQDDLFNVVSFPNTVITMEPFTINGAVILHELRIPCSVEDIMDYYSAFYKSSIAEGIWLNGKNKYINYCSVVEIFAPFVIPETVSWVGKLWELSPYIIFPKTVERIGNIGYTSPAGIRILDFSAATSVPILENYHLNKPRLHRVIVPDELYDAWVNATNWSAFAGYLIKVSDIPWFNK